MRVNRRTAPQAMADREDFTNSTGSLRGKANPGWVSPGWLSDTEALDRLRKDNAREITYVVYSYATPIGWETAEGGFYRVREKFSVTTSQHQGLMYLI